MIVFLHEVCRNSKSTWLARRRTEVVLVIHSEKFETRGKPTYGYKDINKDYRNRRMGRRNVDGHGIMRQRPPWEQMITMREKSDTELG